MRERILDNQIAFYQSPDGSVNIEVLFAEENIWLTQKKMAELFSCSTDNISLHLKNIYQEKEVDQKATTEDFSVVQSEGNREIQRKVTMYSLETVIAVGYRVNSERGAQFRQWAKGKIMPSDTLIAKNYLDKKELKHLNHIGNMYLDYAEMQAARGKAMTMKNWVEKLNAFLKFSEYEILTNAGKISHEVAEALALKEYEKFRREQDKNYISDFDREVKKLLGSKKNNK